MGTRKRNWILGTIFVIALISLVCVSWVASVKQRFDEMRPIALTQIATSRATAETETWLTQEYTEQVSQIIEKFEIKSGSLDFIMGKKSVRKSPPDIFVKFMDTELFQNPDPFG